MTTASASTSVPATSQPLFGILLVVLATLCFAAGDVITKQQTMRHPVAVVQAIRYAVNLGLMTVFLAPSLGPRLWQVNRPGLVFLRSASLASASLVLGTALRLMPVAETLAIVYLAPFAVMVLAIPLLGERVNSAGWIGAALGFLGVLLVVRPGSGLASFGVVSALASVGFTAAYILLTRKLSASESTIAMLYQSALVGTAAFGMVAVSSPGNFVIDRGDMGLLVLLGGLATLAHYFMTAAYREAPASLLAPITYVHIFWAGGLGWLVFGHLPDRWSLTGMALIAAGGVFVAVRAYMHRR